MTCATCARARAGSTTRPAALDAAPAGPCAQRLPRGRRRRPLVRVPGDRYLGLEQRLRGADDRALAGARLLVLAQAARLRREARLQARADGLGDDPVLGAYRNVRTRRYRSLVLRETDLFLAATERARACAAARGRAGRPHPGRAARASTSSASGRRAPGASTEHRDPLRRVGSSGRRATRTCCAPSRRCAAGWCRAPGWRRRACWSWAPDPRSSACAAMRTSSASGTGSRCAASVPYDEMPAVLARASCLVLASLPQWYWEEQFGMVLAEAMAASAADRASSAGAIPEVARPGDTPRFAPGDWLGLRGRWPPARSPPRPGRAR